MDIVTEKWNEIIENLRLEHSLSDVSFKTWILPLKVYDVIENTVYILVTLDGTGDYIDYIEKKYLLPFKVSIAEITGIEYDVKFIPDNPSELEKVEEIANAHNVTSAQVILRWNLQRGVVVIPGSSNPEHIKENTDIYDFELTDEEMQKIEELNRDEKHDWY